MERFKLDNVPAGTNIPIVVQMGKWRRKKLIPTVTACQNNVVDKALTRLPTSHTDGEGGVADIPKMAIASGSADPFECLLLKAGIQPSEIDLPGKGMRVDYYKWNGKDRAPGGAPAGTTLTSDINVLNKYDVVLLPCEGKEVDSHGTDIPNLVKYTAGGGRIFTTHFGYSWLASPSLGVAQNLTEYYKTATWKLDVHDYDDPTSATVDQTFPKGVAYAQWLKNVGASTTLGALSVNEPRHDATVAASVSQRWLYGWRSGLSSASPADMLLSMTFNTPVGAAVGQAMRSRRVQRFSRLGRRARGQQRRLQRRLGLRIRGNLHGARSRQMHRGVLRLQLRLLRNVIHVQRGRSRGVRDGSLHREQHRHVRQGQVQWGAPVLLLTEFPLWQRRLHEQRVVRGA